MSWSPAQAAADSNYLISEITKLCLLFVCDYSVIIAENMDWGLHCLEQEMVRSFSKVTGALLFFKTLQMTSLDQTDK